MGNVFNVQMIAPFGPNLMKATVPSELVEDLNSRVDDIVSDPDKLAQRNWSQNLAGNLKTEIRITDIIQSMPEFSNFLFDVARTYTYRCENALLNYVNYKDTEELKDKTLEIQIKEGWVNEMIAGDFNPVHFHQGCIYSCVLFLRVPDSYEAEFQADKNMQNSVGCLQFIDGRTVVGGKNLFMVKPVVGAFYLWPSWMLHCVYPFRGLGTRRTMSVNLSLG